MLGHWCCCCKLCCCQCYNAKGIGCHNIQIGMLRIAGWSTGLEQGLIQNPVWPASASRSGGPLLLLHDGWHVLNVEHSGIDT
jgi:hypothetical protein